MRRQKKPYRTSGTIPEKFVIEKKLYSAMEKVYDPELHIPITRLGMVKTITADSKTVSILIHITSPTCPAVDKIKQRVTDAASAVCPEHDIKIEIGIMSHQERQNLKEVLNLQKRSNPFKESKTRIIAVTSGKGGVGKSTIVSNLGVGLARMGFSVSVIDADVYGFSIPRMFGIDEDFIPQRENGMIMPANKFGVKLISIGMFMRRRGAVAWRGPLLHRTINQFLCDVNFADPDILLIDMPPGTGDAAITIAQLLPNSEVLVITTPQIVAADVAIRSGQFALSVKQNIIGVVENMSSCPESKLDIFGHGGGKFVAEFLDKQCKKESTAKDNRITNPHEAIDLITCIPLDVNIRKSGDEGVPLLVENKYEGSPGHTALKELYEKIALKLYG
ncbi:Mrp/NBP35 family ATP-binding protein [Tropheryma whipplei]|uniref:Mrp/NBP35 family ATP-binding protein n=1 Tax=Tropheryma whipplei TaxID=2039 RepID=UPI001E5EF811|nr:Mrp/NBP35 family ATP-binding protein [Tropheryma whipplei]